MAEQDNHIVYGESPLQVAFQYANEHNLPIGSKVNVVEPTGNSIDFTVKRSNRSKHMMDGGDLQLVKTPLTGGGSLENGEVLERDHIIHAQNPAQAAMLFAAEADLPGGSYVRVSTQDGKHYQHYMTPQHS